MPLSPIEAAKILIVDDQIENVTLLEQLLQGEGCTQTTSTTDPRQALDLYLQTKPDLLLLDLMMPGLDGYAVMDQVRGVLAPDEFFPILVLTADITPAAKRRALANGAKDFLTKPFDVTEVLLRVQNLLETRHLHLQIQEQNKFLETKVRERTAEVVAQRDKLNVLYERLGAHFMEVMRLFAGLMELHSPNANGHARRVTTLARTLAERCGLTPEQQREIEIAATLHDIGEITIPEEVLARPERLWSESDRALMRKHPQIGQALVSGIEILKSAGVIIRHHHERYDGRGYPDRLMGQAIPLGARILAVADAYDEGLYPRSREYKVGRASVVADLSEKQATIFDPEVVHQLLVHLNAPVTPRLDLPETQIQVEDLIPRMILSRDVYDVRGMLLVAENTTLQRAHIERLQRFNDVEPFGTVYVYQTGKGEPPETPG
jgi:putative two-component system response regulator